MATTEVYLGDGLYASFDGYSVKLRAPRSDGDHCVYLEPDMLASLNRQVEKWTKTGSDDDEDPQGKKLA